MTLNQFLFPSVFFFVCFFFFVVVVVFFFMVRKMTLHVLSFPQTFLVKVTTWSLDYNTSSEATIAAGFFKISH